MKRLMLVSLVVLLAAAWVAAQQTYPSQSSGQTSSQQTSSASSQSGNETKVEGCLSGSEGNYTLTDKSGNKYQLTGDTSKLKEHVGHEVQVTGARSSASASSSAAGESSAKGEGSSQRSIDVTSIKHVSATCSTR